MRAKRAWVRVLLALVAVAAGDLLFWRVGLGLNAALFVLLLLALMLAAGRPGLSRRDGGTVATLGLLAALPLVEEPTPLALTLAALYLALASVTSRQGWTRSLGETARRVVLFGVRAPFQALLDLRRCLAARRPGPGDPAGRGWAGRWVGPLLLTLLFLLLLTAANPVIARALGDVGNAVSRALEGIDPARVAAWLAFGAGAWALLRVRVPCPRAPRGTTLAAAGPRTDTVVRCLALCNVLFLVQNVLDLRFLWLGGALPAGMTFAEYAHRGAYPLVATAILAGVFALFAFPAGGEASGRRGARALVLLFLLQNAFLTLCALQRLHLYVEAYDLTRLRVAAAAWMLLVLFGLLTILWRILRHRTRRWLVGVNLAALFVLLEAGSLLRVDAFVATYNVRHAREMGGHGGPVDLGYLAELGPDALPALERLAREATDVAVRDRAARRATTLRTELEARVTDPRTWTLRRRALLR
jgi:hypothetical protein